MSAPVIQAVESGQLDLEMVVDKEVAALLAGRSSSSIYDLQKKGPEKGGLPAGDLTVQDLYDWATSEKPTTRGAGGRAGHAPGTYVYHVWCTPETASALEGEGLEVIDPRKAEADRRANAEKRARERLASVGVEV